MEGLEVMYVYRSPECKDIPFDRASYLAYLHHLGVRKSAIDNLVIRLKPDLSKQEYAVLNKDRHERYGKDYPCGPINGQYERYVGSIKRPRITICIRNAKMPHETLLHETSHLADDYAPRDTSPQAQEREQQLTAQYEAKQAEKPFNAYWYLPYEVRAREFAEHNIDRVFIHLPCGSEKKLEARAASVLPASVPQNPKSPATKIPAIVVVGYLTYKFASTSLKKLLLKSR